MFSQCSCTEGCRDGARNRVTAAPIEHRGRFALQSAAYVCLRGPPSLQGPLVERRKRLRGSSSSMQCVTFAPALKVPHLLVPTRQINLRDIESLNISRQKFIEHKAVSCWSRILLSIGSLCSGMRGLNTRLTSSQLFLNRSRYCTMPTDSTQCIQIAPSRHRYTTSRREYLTSFSLCVGCETFGALAFGVCRLCRRLRCDTGTSGLPFVAFIHQ